MALPSTSMRVTMPVSSSHWSRIERGPRLDAPRRVEVQLRAVRILLAADDLDVVLSGQRLQQVVHVEVAEAQRLIEPPRDLPFALGKRNRASHRVVRGEPPEFQAITAAAHLDEHRREDRKLPVDAEAVARTR